MFAQKLNDKDKDIFDEYMIINVILNSPELELYSESFAYLQKSLSMNLSLDDKSENLFVHSKNHEDILKN